MSGDAVSYRLPPGIGVIQHAGRIVVYEVEGDEVLWVRPLGMPCLELTPALCAAVWADRKRA